jgi:glycosyltransferase involved in cell wall biosynthesis
MLRCSIIIPCYNQGRYLAEAIDSALSQTHPFVEVIVVNDGSSDDTAAVAASYGDRIKYIEQPQSGVCAAARNTGILASSGELLNFLDADDFLHGDAMARVVEEYQANPQLGLVYGDYEFVDQRGKQLQYVTTPAPPSDPFHWLLAGNRWPCHMVVIRRETLGQIGVFDPTLRACEDWDLWTRAAAAGTEFYHVPHTIGSYRRYPGSMSDDMTRMWVEGQKVLQKNAKVHRNCPDCQRAVRVGRSWLRGYCLPPLRHLVLKGGFAGISRALLILLRHPSFIPPAMYDSAWRIRDFILRRDPHGAAV